jgi:adenosyl cobinamide kinase/adenosyl cobinamide phosphate guanylyltransferase
MSLVLLLGGARSGKSSLAVELARRRGGSVVVVATAEARDDEMAARIRAHRAERPAEWGTVEEPVDVAAALARVDDEATLVLDCLSLWVANLLERGDGESDVEERARKTAACARGRSGLSIAVSNEVGLGVVPPSALGRRYRDVLGRVNAEWAAAADDALLVVAGRALRLDPPTLVL